MTTDILKKKNEPRVKWELSIACGCGVKPESAQAATDHAAKTGHTLTVHGVIGFPMSNAKVRVV